MEFETAKFKALQCKLALAVAIVRNKPENLSAKQFTCLIQHTFRQSYDENKQMIKNLKDSLLKCKQENYLLKNKSAVEQADETLGSQANKTVINYLNSTQLKSTTELAQMQQFLRMTQTYEENMDFLLNLVKLKVVGKNFQLDENAETIMQTLKRFLVQIRYLFFHDYNNNNISSESEVSQQTSLLLSESTDSAINMSYSATFDSTFDTSSQPLYTFPHDSLLHALQIFLNIFQIEWLYYLKNSLLDLLTDFIDEIVKFVVECDQQQVQQFHSTSKIQCACQMLICLSSCDYLLDHILQAILFALQNSASYLCENHDSTPENQTIVASLLQNIVSLLDTFDTIVNLRNLDNFSKISSNTRNDLNKFLNTVFIQVTDLYPILAIKMAKSIQMLNIKNKK